MKRPRPYIPLKVRAKAAQLQLMRIPNRPELITIARQDSEPYSTLLGRLRIILAFHLQCQASELHLDHNPALILRRFNPSTGKYTPAANDPEFLIYRSAHDHHIKTNIRGDGAQFSDTALRKREKRREKKKAAGRTKAHCRLKYAISGSPKRYSGHVPRWASGRKIPSRPFPRRP